MSGVLLSKRMQALADLVDKGALLCDVGCDHGYLPIWLLENHVIKNAIAMDINQGPLDRAAINMEKATENGTIPEGCITLRLSNGLEKLSAGEADTVTIAGMGGNLILDILKAKPEVTGSLHTLILQPQSDVPLVREWLLSEGFFIEDEDMVEEDGKYYPMMKVHPASAKNQSVDEDRKVEIQNAENRKEDAWTEEEIRYGKRLIEKNHPVLVEYLHREERIKGEILKSLERSAKSDERSDARKQEVIDALEMIRQVRFRMGDI